MGPAEVRGELRSRLATVLTTGGWTLDPVRESLFGSLGIAAFRRPITDEFSVTAEFEDDQGPVLSVSAEFFVSYERSYRLWPVVQDYPVSAEIEVSETGRDAPKVREDFRVVVGSARALPGAVDKLSAMAARAVTEASDMASVDVVLEVLRSREVDSRADAIPVVLAAAGRFDEARRAIDEYRALRDPYTHTADYRRLASRLTGWIDAGAVLPGPPAPLQVRADNEETFEPPPAFEHVEPLSFLQVWRQSKERSAQLKAARAAVEKQRLGKSRDELRVLYEAELAARRLTGQPRATELVLDRIEAGSPAEKRAVGWRAMGEIAGLVTTTVKDLKAIGQPPAAWLEPPLAASYEVLHRHGEWFAVETDPLAQPVLDRALEGVVHGSWRDDRVNFDAWLTAANDEAAGTRRLGVHVGVVAVAQLSQEDSDRFATAFDAAATRGELPFMAARITRHPAGPSLELGVPYDIQP
jgi:hypothetical protein